ncbi:MAG: MBL fold metallo-hydrolase [Bdellovibrionales bacterium]|nr:MBL fold metallo-hydrolase [Bdellovibrionales bacterium]
MSVRITFLGAAGTVTGSKYLVESGRHRILVDAGLFQGTREWRERNWHDPEIDLKTVDAVLLTHAHIDHTGILPRYVKLGLKCPVFATAATAALAKLLLPDSAKLQEEEAKYRKDYKKSRHHPPLALYTSEDAQSALKLFHPVSFHKAIEIAPGVKATWNRMGHILGAGSIQLEIGGKIITFSGDIGRYSVPILKDPEPVALGDLLLIESTYGNRLHADSNPQMVLKKVIKDTVKRGGVVVIPSFAVGRTQLVLYYLRELKEAREIPNIPIVIDSPMATDATSLYREFPEDYDEEALGILGRGTNPFSADKLYFTRSVEESKKINSMIDPMIIISASGMLSGGRILHHLLHRISSPLNTILFVGYQPPGSRGDWIKSGASSLRIFGSEVAIKAKVEEISGLSAHGDREELLRWCTECRTTPGKVAVVHGEPDSAKDFSLALEDKFGWNAFVAEYKQTLEL